MHCINLRFTQATYFHPESQVNNEESVTDLCEESEWQRHEYGDDPRDSDDCQTDSDRHARSQRMQYNDVSVDSDGSHRQRRHVDEGSESEVGQCTGELSECPAGCQVPGHVERDVDQCDEDVADCQVGYEHVGDAVQTTVTPYDVADECVGEQRQTEDDQVGSTEQDELCP